MSAEKPQCHHLYTRRAGWWRHRVTWFRYRCVKCGYLTRHYDTIDRWMSRPIHQHMSVAYSGYNTTR